MVLEFIPTWGINILKLIAVVIGFYLLGLWVVKPISWWFLKNRGDIVADPLSRVAQYVTVVLGVGVGLTVGGYGNVLTTFGTIVAAGTLALGFAMKDTISSMVAGLFLLIDRPFEAGDWIEWDGKKGKVMEIRLRTTEVKTFDNEVLIVPNNDLAGSTIKNPVAEDKLRVQIEFGIGYEDDIDQARNILENILDNVDAIAEEPGPDIKLVELDDSSVNLKARYWLRDPKRADFVGTRDKVLQRVKDKFDEEGIDIPYPTRTIAGDSLNIEQE